MQVTNRNPLKTLRGCLGLVCLIIASWGFMAEASAQNVTYSRKDLWHEEWLIDKPEVKQAQTYYPQIIVRGGDIVKFSAQGCVNTHGSGLTTKDFVNPKGPNSESLYFGTVFIPGVNNNHFQRIQVGKEFTVPLGQEGPIGIGYMDDEYGDNDYANFDGGNDGQCVNKGPAQVVVNILRSERWCRSYAYWAIGQNQGREKCGKAVPSGQYYRWHPDFRVHYQWCLANPNWGVQTGEYDARADWLSQQGCPSLKYAQMNYCDKYSAEAVAQDTIRKQCGKPVPQNEANRWDDNAVHHYDWCSAVPKSVAPEATESDARTTYLNDQLCIAGPVRVK